MRRRIQEAKGSPNRATYAIFIVLLYLFMRVSGDHGLIDQLEGFNASVAVSMEVHGELLHPSVGSLPCFSKSMGFLWLSMLGLDLFGGNEFSVRFFPALAALGMALAACLLARRGQGPRAGNYAAIITGSSLLTYIPAQIASPHTLFAFCSSMALWGALAGLKEKGGFLWLHVFAALGLIFYGPAGIMLPWLALFLYAYLIDEEYLTLRALSYWPGLLASFVLCGGYLGVLYMRDPFLLSMMLYNPSAQAFGTFFSSLSLLLIGFCPWIGVLLESLRDLCPRSLDFDDNSHKDEVLYLVWLAVFALFGLLSGDGLTLASLIPACAAICAVPLAKAVETRDSDKLRRFAALEIVILTPLMLVIIFCFYRYSPWNNAFSSILLWSFFLCLFLFANWFYAKTRQPFKLLRFMCLTSLLCVLPLGGAFKLFSDSVSMQKAGYYLREKLVINSPYEERNDLLAQYAINRPSLYFYAVHDSIIVDGEALPLVLGQKTITTQALREIWRGPRRVLMLLPQGHQITGPFPEEVYRVYEADGLVVLSNRGNI